MGLTRTLPLPIFVSLIPFIEFYERNRHQGITLLDLAPYFAGTALVVGAVVLLIHLIFRLRTTRGVALSAVFVVVFFSYYNVASFLETQGAGVAGQSMGWFALLIVAMTAAGVWGARSGFVGFLWVFAVAAAAVPAYGVVAHPLPPQGPGLSIEKAYPLGDNSIWSGVPVRTPNIYWFVLDSYPNAEQLQDYYRYDNSAFLGYLRSKGFYVANESYANYSDTRLSVPATLNMEYPFEGGEEYELLRGRAWVPLPGRTNRGTIAAVAGDNRSVGFLKQIGYRYVHFEGRSFNLTRCRGYEDHCIRGVRGLTELDVNLLLLTPHRIWRQVAGESRLPFKRGRSLSFSGTGIPELSRALGSMPVESPFFLYAHLSTPHPPFVNDHRCRFGMFPMKKVFFVRQVRCVNRHLRGLINGLVERDPEAIVVLSSDHGARLSVPSGTPIYAMNTEQIRESLGVLNAYRMPASCREFLYPEISPVNGQRLLFACLGGHAPVFLEPKHFIVRGGHPDGGKIRRVSLGAE